MNTLVRVTAFVFVCWWVAAAVCEDDNGYDDHRNATGEDKDLYVVHATVYQVGILTNKSDDDVLANKTGEMEALTLFHTNGTQVDLTQLPRPLLTNITAQSFVGVTPVDQEHALPALTQTNLPSQKQSSNLKVKRETSGAGVLKIEQGTGQVPAASALSLPPLLALGNLTLPVPNTAVVHYAKIDSVIKQEQP